MSDDMLSALQVDIVNVISKYFEIDSGGIKLDITKSEDQSALVFNTPILAARHTKK